MSLLRNFATVGGATLSSRVLGFIRDSFIAAAVGAGPVAEAYTVALRLANMFRRLFAEGAFASAFVPLFAGKLEAEGAESARAFARETLAAMGVLLLVVTIVVEIFMPQVTFLLAPGFASDPEKFALTVALSRIAFPYLALISLVTLYSGVLNGLDRFAAAAFAPSLLNAVLIGALVFVFFTHAEGTVTAGYWLTWANIIGGVLQLVVLVVASARADMHLSLMWPRLTAGVKRLCVLAGPSIIAGGVVQINVFVGTVIASTQEGAVAWLYYADRVYQLPLGVVGIAIGIVLLPDIARRVRAGDLETVNHSLNRSLEFAMVLTLPAAAALLAVPLPLTIGLFERGAFSAADSVATASALAAFGAGLPAFVLIKVFQPAFFARQDTRTPMWYSAINMVVNVVLSLALFPVFGHVGVAMATSAASWLNVVLLYSGLRRAGLFSFDRRLISSLWRIAAATVLMAAALVGLAYLLAPLTARGGWLRIEALAGLVIGGGVVYCLAAIAFGAIRRSEIARVLKGRRGRGKT